jgi:hypothetical protein
MIISFETSKLLKAVNYREHTLGVRWSDGKYDGEESYLFFMDEPNIYPSPTQSELQTWLRKEHKIHVNCHPSKWEGNRLISYSWTIRDFRNKGEYYSGDEVDYESALKVGLREALKLIKQ